MQFGQRLAKAGEVGKTYTFAVFVKSLFAPAPLRLEIERPASPWDRVVKSPAVVPPQNQWTELHVTFKVEKPFEQGWFCYLSGGGDGARLRLDLFRVYEGEYVPWKAPARSGGRPCRRRASRHLPMGASRPKRGRGPSSTVNSTTCGGPTAALVQLARLLANMGVAAQTPLLARFSNPATPSETRGSMPSISIGPRTWDYPYRFFCW